MVLRAYITREQMVLVQQMVLMKLLLILEQRMLRRLIKQEENQ